MGRRYNATRGRNLFHQVATCGRIERQQRLGLVVGFIQVPAQQGGRLQIKPSQADASLHVSRVKAHGLFQGSADFRGEYGLLPEGRLACFVTVTDAQTKVVLGLGGL
jgi:hypothetical protein